MEDSFRVAIVARAHDSAAPIDPRMEEFEANLKPHMPVLRAAHMDDVDQCVNDFWSANARADRRLTLMICGHGSAGIMHLGSSWMQPSASVPLDAFREPYFLIDTNPWSLRRIGHHRDKFDAIHLVACNVGMVEADGYCINGRTLSYTMCEHLNTTVHAAMDWVAPSEVKTGEYVPEKRAPSRWMYTKTRTPVYIDPEDGRVPSPQVVDKAPKRFRIVEIVGVRVPARRLEKVGTAIAIEAVRIDDPRLVHASPELLLEVVAEDGASSPATMYGNGRVLQVAGTFYAIEPAAPTSHAIAKTLAR